MHRHLHPTELSVVIPVYNEEQTLPELYRRVTAVLADVSEPCEVVLVDDGSRDNSAALMAAITTRDASWRGVYLSRNFGHQAAVAAGLQFARGRAVVVMDADLQDPPELIPELVVRWREGYQVVYAQRARRRGVSLAKRVLYFIYYRTLRRLTRIEVPADTGDFCLMDRRIVDLLNQMPERNRYVRGLRAWVGFRQTAIRYDRPQRYAGEAKYTFRKLLGLALNGIFSLSNAPLRLATYLGLVVSASSFGLASFYVVERIVVGTAPRGWASTVVIVLFLGGVQLLTIGIIGEYLSRIYEEVKQRPLYVVRAADEATGTSSPAPAPVPVEMIEPPVG